MNDFAELSKKLGLLEIYTLQKYPESRHPRNSKIERVHYKIAYSKQLEKKHPFNQIDWDNPHFENFSILKESPPQPLIEDGGVLDFGSAETVADWDSFIDSFRQLRNNITHGAKFFDSLQLEPRDKELINAGLAFIDFLDGEFSLNLGG